MTLNERTTIQLGVLWVIVVIIVMAFFASTAQGAAARPYTGMTGYDLTVGFPIMQMDNYPITNYPVDMK